MELIKGRPDGEGRQEREMRTYDMLDSLGIEYWRVDHKAAENMEDCREVDNILQVVMCKNLFLCNRQQTAFYMLLMPDTKNFKTKEISSQINSARLSFASGDKMEELLDIHPGAVSVMGLMNDPEGRVQLLVDEDLLQEEYFGCHPCVNTSSLKLRTKDIFDVFLPAVHHAYRTVRLVGDRNPLEK